MSIWVTWPGLVKFGTLGITAGLLTLAVERNELFWYYPVETLVN